MTDYSELSNKELLEYLKTHREDEAGWSEYLSRQSSNAVKYTPEELEVKLKSRLNQGSSYDQTTDS